MYFNSRSRLFHYGVAVAAVLTALIIAVLLKSAVDERNAYLLFVTAIAVSAGYGGIGPGILSTVLSGLVIDLLFLAPRFSLFSHTRPQLIDLAMFVTVGLVASVASQVLHNTQRRAEIARADAESTRHSLTFLADASVKLDSSLEYETTLKNVALMSVGALADWCSIEISEDGDSIRRVAVAHKDAAKVELVEQLQSRYPLNALGQNPVHKVLQTGQSDIYLDIPDSSLMAAARDAEHLSALRALQIRSYLCVPMRARGRTIGVIFFASARPDRYTTPDRILAEDLARRAALAVDNARLYRAAQEEIERRTQTEAELEHRQGEVVDLNERLRRSMIETHHRVKNNLQVIAAMIDMRTMDDETTVSMEEIRRLGAYVQTMAAVHDILTHESKEEAGIETVSAKVILSKLLPLMQQTGSGRNIEYELADVPLTPKQGTSLALLVNELISNAIKHGKGEITLRMAVSDNVASLEVCDDGEGLPEGFDPAKAANTGLDLILSLARWDLGGKACFSNRPEGGARVVVTFPVQKPLEA
jgi:two-component sensor histidine kinase